MNARRIQASFLHHGSNKPSEVYSSLKMHPHLRQCSPESLPNPIQTAPSNHLEGPSSAFLPDCTRAPLRPHGNHFTQRSHPVNRRALGCRGNGGMEKSGPHPDPRRSLSGAGRRSLAISPGPATRWLIYRLTCLLLPNPCCPPPPTRNIFPLRTKAWPVRSQLDPHHLARSTRLHKSRPHPCDT